MPSTWLSQDCGEKEPQGRGSLSAHLQSLSVPLQTIPGHHLGISFIDERFQPHRLNPSGNISENRPLDTANQILSTHSK